MFRKRFPDLSKSGSVAASHVTPSHPSPQFPTATLPHREASTEVGRG